MTNHVKPFLCAVAAVAFLSASATASAETQWQKAHPRRTEVNARLSNQNRRIHNEVQEGEISHAQAAQLHHDDAQVRQEEHDMASQNNGHITRQEQRTLNRQENGISGQIGQ